MNQAIRTCINLPPRLVSPTLHCLNSISLVHMSQLSILQSVYAFMHLSSTQPSMYEPIFSTPPYPAGLLSRVGELEALIADERLRWTAKLADDAAGVTVK